MVRLLIKEPESVSFYPSEKAYPHEIRLELMGYYNKVLLETDSRQEEYTKGFYVLDSHGYIQLKNPIRSTTVKIFAELPEFRIPGEKPLSLRICSKPISRSEIYEIDEKLRPDDIKISWSIDGYGFLEGRYDVGLIPIFVGTDRDHDISRSNFVKNVIEKVELLRREFIEVVVEPIDLSFVKDSRVRGALQLLSEKQKLLLAAKSKLAEAKTSTDFRGVIDEVRRVVEGLYKLDEICGEAYRRLGYIESTNIEAIDEASKEMANALVESKTGLTGALFHYASRFGIHTETLNKKPYTPNPTRTEAEFAVQQALLNLNYLIRLLNAYATRI
ncbi:MAG: hypothetical protein QXF82_08000 [Nitrososphaeria archaeon]